MIKIDGFRVYSDVEGAKVRRLRDGLRASSMTLFPSETEADFAEVLPDELAAIEAAERQAEQERERERRYAALVSAFVHERYSVDDEIAMLANAMAPALLSDDDRASALATELEQYQEYRAQCKQRAREELEQEKDSSAEYEAIDLTELENKHDIYNAIH